MYKRTSPIIYYCKLLEKRVQKIAPKKGNIRLLTVTEKQYEDMRLIIGSKKEMRKNVGTERMLIL